MASRTLLSVLLLVLLPAPAGGPDATGAGPATPPGCWGLLAPVDGPLVRSFAPGADGYSGHWGIDLAVPVGEPVRAPAAGVVTFAGTVVEIEAVTVHHGGGLRSTVSSLGSIAVSVGDRVEAGAVLGTAGEHDGRPAVHLSLRIGGRYVDPAPAMRCRPSAEVRGLRLVPVPR